MLQLPTGGGKTVIFSAIALKFLQQGEGVLVVAHRKELIVQAKEKLEAVTGLECGMIKARFPIHPDRDIQVASIQSLSRRRSYPDVGLVIIDEAHHCAAKSYTDLIEKYPKAYILGLTATPCRIDGQGFQHYFEDLIEGTSTAELIESGFLSKYKLFASTPINTKGIKKVGGEFSQSQLEENALKIVGDLVPTWRKYANGKQTIIFGVTVSHSKTIVKKFLEAGIPAEHVDGETPDSEREDIIERFKNKETVVLSNVGIFTEGFDAPGVEAIQCVRPTCSPGLWQQMVGRGLRIAPGKLECIIMDHTENWKFHGLPDDDRTWTLDAVSLPPQRWTLRCELCNHCFKPTSFEQKPYKKIALVGGELKDIYKSTCPHCRHQFDWDQGKGGAVPVRHFDEDKGEITEVNLTCNQWAIDFFHEMRLAQEATGKKVGWIYYKAIEHPRAKDFSVGDWRYLGKILGYKSGWAMKVFLEVQASKLKQSSLAW